MGHLTNDSLSITPLRERVAALALDLIPAEVPPWMRTAASMARPFLALRKDVPSFAKSALAVMETGKPQAALGELDRVTDEQMEQFLTHVIERLEWVLHGDSEH